MPQFIIDVETKEVDKFIEQLLALPEVKRVKKVISLPKPAKETKPRFVGLRRRDPSIDMEEFSGMLENTKGAKELIESAWRRKKKG